MAKRQSSLIAPGWHIVLVVVRPLRRGTSEQPRLLTLNIGECLKMALIGPTACVRSWTDSRHSSDG